CHPPGGAPGPPEALKHAPGLSLLPPPPSPLPPAGVLWTPGRGGSRGCFIPARRECVLRVVGRKRRKSHPTSSRPPPAVRDREQAQEPAQPRLGPGPRASPSGRSPAYRRSRRPPHQGLQAERPPLRLAAATPRGSHAAPDLRGG